MKRIKRFLEDYNTAMYEMQCESPLPCISEILFLGSDFWKVNPSIKLTDSSIPWQVKEELSQAFLVMQRSDEEVLMLEADMTTMMHYLFNRLMVISKRLDDMTSDEDSYSRGARSLLEHLKLETELQHQRALTAFSQFIHVPNTAVLTTSKTSEEFESSDDDDDDDDYDSASEGETYFSEPEF